MSKRLGGPVMRANSMYDAPGAYGSFFHAEMLSPAGRKNSASASNTVVSPVAFYCTLLPQAARQP